MACGRCSIGRSILFATRSPLNNGRAWEWNYQANPFKNLLLSRELMPVLHHLREFDVDVLPCAQMASKTITPPFRISRASPANT
jgi:hypothetical protein